jgi:sulfur-carrier protein
MSEMATPAAGTPATAPIRIAMPHQLRALARITGEAVVEVVPPVTLGATMDALEIAHPTLVGTIRDRDTGRRRAMIRLYAAGEDFSDRSADTLLPAPVRDGDEPLRLVGAIAGG